MWVSLYLSSQETTCVVIDMHAVDGTNRVAIPSTDWSMREIAPKQVDAEYSSLPGFQLKINWIYDTVGGIYPHRNTQFNDQQCDCQECPVSKMEINNDPKRTTV